jgi:hypothetical protein
MPSIPSQCPTNSTMLAQAGSAAGSDHSAGSLTHHHGGSATSGLGTEGQNPSWPYGEPAEIQMFSPASTNVCSYPIDIEVPSTPPAQFHDYHERVHRPIANGPEVVTMSTPRVPRPHVPQPLERYPAQGNNAPTVPRRQHTDRHLPSHGSPSTATDDCNNRLAYPHSTTEASSRPNPRKGKTLSNQQSYSVTPYARNTTLDPTRHCASIN